MAHKLEGFYFGRFQPPLLKHGEIASKIRAEFDLHLVVGVANNLFGLSRENFLTGIESRELFVSTLDYLGVIDTEVVTVDIHTDRSFVKSLEMFFNQRGVSRENGGLVFSGSGSTIKACTEIAERYGLSIIRLDDDDLSGPRARQVREGLLCGDDILWKDLVCPDVHLRLKNVYPARIRDLGNDIKRPWATA